MESVGIVGLGQIGGAIAASYVKDGIAPVVYDVRPEVVESTVAEGATAATGPGDLARQSDVILICVRDDRQCLDLMPELLTGAREGGLVAITSTVTPDTIATVVAAGDECGVTVVDAPVAGQGVRSIESRTMNVLVGGGAAIVDRLRPLVAPWGRVVAAGPIGSGAVLKLAHNTMVFAGYSTMVEAVELARAAGVRDGLVQELTRTSGTLSDQGEIFLEIYERRSRGESTPEEDENMKIFAALHDKDLGHAVAVARANGRELPVAALCVGKGEELFVVDLPKRST